MHTGLEERGLGAGRAYYAARAAGLIVTAGWRPTARGACFAAGLMTATRTWPTTAGDEAVHAAGGRIAAQILHAGRYASGRTAWRLGGEVADLALRARAW
jgi:2,4-dienoyl-CoA reductase (NADPH2)